MNSQSTTSLTSNEILINATDTQQESSEAIRKLAWQIIAIQNQQGANLQSCLTSNEEATWNEGDAIKSLLSSYDTLPTMRQKEIRHTLYAELKRAKHESAGRSNEDGLYADVLLRSTSNCTAPITLGIRMRSNEIETVTFANRDELIEALQDPNSNIRQQCRRQKIVESLNKRDRHNVRADPLKHCC